MPSRFSFNTDLTSSVNAPQEASLKKVKVHVGANSPWHPYQKLFIKGFKFQYRAVINATG
jgi:hypothetical protein